MRFVFLLLWLVVPFAAKAQFTFITNNGAITITGYTGGGTVIIPSSTNGWPVKNIGDTAFNFRGITSVTIPTSVTNIGDSAFASCHSLATVTILDGVTEIKSYAFNSCYKLTNVFLGSNVVSIGDYAFSSCSTLTNLTFPNSLTNIGTWTFADCYALSTLIIPDSVASIGASAFVSCDHVTNLVVGSGLKNLGNLAFGCTKANTIFFKGNLPTTAGINEFPGVNTNTPVYYLAGTTGWTSTFGGLQTVLWNPQAQTGDGSFGVRSNQFGFNVTGATNIPIVVEACTNFGGNWTALQSLSLTNGTFYFTDSQWANFPSRFYRFRSP